MIVDSSALVAILMEEAEAAEFSFRLATEDPMISAASLTECMIVLHGKAGEGMVRELDVLLRSAAVAVLPVDEAQARLAGNAYARYGRGSGSPARLNYGDCFSYALAITRDEPLLFKGDDFVHTDVRRMESA
ncbi:MULTISPECIES: type II toxin-antitoxin system VapC family toxin [unclassified Microbacterium]|uniref:type II toxin-antitoxin system VapC family toxin n=1 Tax=unclassified Microbacterium TaxID=2609290 RepID=UPI0016055CCE|nr:MULTISPECIES: type II toxin-antitoxin system VapC family toxin [unclassified Microbacterium]QNA91594.1 type II toxin-antitoxin system VapC family toxin [Microbacterium sp. Se63.02b]QYM64770.1 type II toxin-antitoxin system VapC family toxin [Microbacterium sp. Se5.02b]